MIFCFKWSKFVAKAHIIILNDLVGAPVVSKCMCNEVLKGARNMHVRTRCKAS